MIAISGQPWLAEASGWSEAGWVEVPQTPDGKDRAVAYVDPAGGAAVESEHPGYSGSGYVGGFVDANRGNATVSFALTGSTAGAHNLTIRYANGTGGPRTMSLVVNGSARQISLPATANWGTWSTTRQTVSLNGGTNTIGLRYGTADNGNVNATGVFIFEIKSGKITLLGDTKTLVG